MSELTPITRIESYLDAIVNSGTPPLEDITRIETFLQAIYDNTVCALTPITRIEMFLGKISGQDIVLPEPITRIELYLAAIAGEDVELPEEPITRIEMYLADWADSGDWTTISGAIVEFIATRAHKLKSCVVSLSPQQDLHGYDSPWPAGGGKNKLDAESTFTNPTTSLVIKTLTLKPNTQYTASTNHPIGSGTTAAILLADMTETLSTGTCGFWNGTSRTKTTDENGQLRIAYRLVDSETAATFLAYNYQLEEGSSATSFAPYSNICPISGWTGCTVYDDSKYGGLINFNQLVQNGDFSDGLTNWAYNQTVTVSDGVATWETPGYYSNFYQININFASGHKYLATIRVKTTEKVSLNVNGQTVFYNHQGSGEWETVGNIVTVTSVTPAENRFRFMCTTVGGATTDILLKDAMVFDLTQMFGAGNEPLTVGEFEELFPHDYYPYNAGEETIVSKVNGDPYREVSVTFGETVYGATPDIVSGEMPVTMGYVDLGNLTWTKESGRTESIIRFATTDLRGSIKKPSSGSEIISAICSQYAPSNANNSYLGYNEIVASDTSGKIFIVDTRYDALAANEFKAAMSGVLLVYELATPIPTTITPTPITALKGYNAMWSDGGDIEVTVHGTPVEVETLQALNMLLGGAYRNDGTEDDVSDEEALDIILGGEQR